MIITAGMKAAAPVLNLVFISLLLTQSVTPLSEFLIKHRLSPNLAVSVTILIVIIVGLAVLSLLGSSLAGLLEKLPTYQMRLSELRASVVTFLSSMGIDPSKLMPEDVVPTAKIIRMAGNFLRAIAHALGDGIIILLLVVFMLFEFTAMRQKDRRSPHNKSSFISGFDEMSKDTSKYAAIVGLSGLLQTIANVIALRALNVDSAVIWGVFFFCLHLIPYVGFFFALIPPVVVALLYHGWYRAVAVIIVWSATNFLFDNIIRPRFLKKGLDIQITLIFFALLYWGWVLGPIGVILAVPLTLTMRRLIAEFGKPIDHVYSKSDGSS